jgi:hypothetical protein
MAQLAAQLPAAMRGDYASADPAQRNWIEYLEEGGDTTTR